MKTGPERTPAQDGGPTAPDPSTPAPSATALVPPGLALLRLELVFTMDEPVALSPFRGNLWRGILGPALKHIDDGLLPGVSTGAIAPGSLYCTFFESPPPPSATKMRRYTATPHPYVVDAPGRPDERLEAGATERIGLTLVGRAGSALEAVLAAFDFAARVGIGHADGPAGERGRAHLTEARAVWRADARDLVVFDESSGFRPAPPEVPVTPACPPRLRVVLATPLRLVREGKLVDARHFTPAALVSNLVRRVSMLSEFYGELPLDADFRALKGLWEGLAAEQKALADADLTRWSSRQRHELNMDGVVGSFVLNMLGREALFPYLWLSQWVHAGKGAVTGMGAIRLRPE